LRDSSGATRLWTFLSLSGFAQGGSHVCLKVIFPNHECKTDCSNEPVDSVERNVYSVSDIILVKEGRQAFSPEMGGKGVREEGMIGVALPHLDPILDWEGRPKWGCRTTEKKNENRLPREHKLQERQQSNKKKKKAKQRRRSIDRVSRYHIN